MSDHSARPDPELVLALAGGDLGALSEIYLRHGQSVLRFLCGAVLDRGSAEDLCQETFLSLPRVLRRYQERGSLRGFLLSLAARRVRSWRRRRWLREKLLGENQPLLQASRGETPEEQSIATQSAQRLSAALARLPAGQRDALVLQLGENMRGAEIAETLGVGHATVRVWLHRAKESLLEALDDSTEGGAP